VKAATPATNPVAWLALCLVTVIVYLPGLSGDYMFDDMSNLLDNPRLEMESLSLDNLASAAFSSGAGDLRRPVSMASFALNRYFFGIAPYSHKVVNLGIHLLTGLGLWWLGSLLLRACRPAGEPGLTPGVVRWLPLIVAGLWLVHPLNLTTVLYIVQRMAGLAALFTVFGLCLYLLGRLRMQSGQPGLVHILTGLLLFGGLAVFSKENGILLPLYMLVLEVTLFRFRSGQPARDRRIITLFVVTLAIPALLFLLALLIYPDKLMNYSVRTFNMQERLLTEARVLVFYLKLIVMPSISELGLFHDDISISRGLLDPPATLFAILALAGLLFAALALRTRQALVSLGILWFFAGHVLESTVLSLEIAHEHRNYLADYGILLAACALPVQAAMQRVWPFLRIAGLAAFLLFSITTWVRAGQWSDNVNHSIYEALHHPQSPRALFGAGRIFARMALEHIPDSEQKAFDYLARAGAIDKSEIIPDVTYMLLKYHLDQPVDDELFETIKYKLRNYPVSAANINSLKELVECTGNGCNIPAHHMEEIFSIALEQTYSPQLNTIYGFYRINTLSDFEGGLAIFRRVLEEKPREPQNWINLVNLLLVMQRPDEAVQVLERIDDYDLYGGNQLTRELLGREIANARQSSAVQLAPPDPEGARL
jgi:tetratricopeptide (TPR) repeat protein